MSAALRVAGFLAALALAVFHFSPEAAGRTTLLAQNAPEAIASALRGFSLANVDPTCQPCQDFYRYAMGGWHANNPIPPTAARWSALDQLRVQNRAVLRELLESAEHEPNAPGSPAQRAADYYAACTNTRERDTAGTAPIAVYLRAIHEIRDLDDLRLETAVAQNVAANAFFSTGSEADPRDGQRLIPFVAQGGLALPDRELYFANDARAIQIRDAFLAHAARYFTLLGDEPQVAAAGAHAVMSVELALARASRTGADRRDRFANYHKMALSEAQTLVPSWNLASFFRDRMAQHVEYLDVEQPEYLRALETLLRTQPLADLRAYLRYHLIERAAPALSMAFSEEYTNFRSTLSGRREPDAVWMRCVRMTDNDVPDALGQVYAARYGNPEIRATAKRLVDNLEAALRDHLTSPGWMSEPTRREALAKLDAIADRVGYPDAWRTYDGLEIDRGPFITDSLRTSLYRARHTFAMLGHTADRRFWAMSPPTINASYDPGANAVTLPAGILQPPLFSPRYDDAVNYGAIGAIIGHELSHAFDDEGRRTDARGALRDWWQPADAAAFAARLRCIEREYDRFAVGVGDFRENPKLVVGEALADLGGAEIAYRALERELAGKPRPKIDGWTPEQRFFLAFTQAHAAYERPERARLDVLIDPHPSGRNRVIGTLSNMPEFATAFGCRAHDAMVRPASQRCSLW
ncbi:MAG: M13 family metallopeptidase [Candidatus Eremiobacteraeota bacterium]|nr:M13 family metallopeptidase [Candidatus Eremiobacteraeota bacterium]